AAMANVLPDDQAIDSVAAYIASLPMKNQIRSSGLPGSTDHGKALYRNCAVCHGEQGQGIWSAGAPRLAGMQSSYLAAQLKNFRDGIRGYHRNDQYGQQMAAMAALLSGDQAVDDVVAYISTLGATPQKTDSTQTAMAGGTPWNK